MAGRACSCRPRIRSRWGARCAPCSTTARGASGSARGAARWCATSSPGRASPSVTWPCSPTPWRRPRRFASVCCARYMRAGRVRAGPRVRLLFFSPHYGTVGGVRSIIDALAAAARAAGHEVSAIVDGGGPGTFGRAHDLLLYPFPARARELHRLRRFAQKFPLRAVRLVSAVRAAAPDVVSVHCTRRFAPYVAVLRRAAGPPPLLSPPGRGVPPRGPGKPGPFLPPPPAARAPPARSAGGAAD